MFVWGAGRLQGLATPDQGQLIPSPLLLKTPHSLKGSMGVIVRVLSLGYSTPRPPNMKYSQFIRRYRNGEYLVFGGREGGGGGGLLILEGGEYGLTTTIKCIG